MKQNLDTLKTEVLEQLGAMGVAVFHCFSRDLDETEAVYWDVHHYPDFRLFLEAARRLDVKLMTLNHREFTSEAVEEAFERLEDCEVSPEERRSFERRLREVSGYGGFTCAIELGFQHQDQWYLYSLQTPWYSDFLDLLDEIDSFAPEGDGEDEGPMGGYFSKN